MDDYNDVNIIIDIVEYCSAYNLSTSYKLYESLLLVDYDDLVMLIHITEKQYRISTFGCYNHNYLINLYKNQYRDFYHRCNSIRRVHKSDSYPVLIDIISSHLVPNNMKAFYEIRFLLYQKEIQLLQQKLSSINVLFKLYIKNKSIILILHQDFDLNGSIQYIVTPSIEKIYVAGKHHVKGVLYRNMTMQINDEIVSLSDLSMNRKKEIIKLISPAFYQYLCQEVFDAVTLIMKLYFEVSYNSWDLVFKSKSQTIN